MRAFELLGFHIVREGNHIVMQREGPKGDRTTLTLPNHPRIKASTLRGACSQAGLLRNEFLKAYQQ
ncbi:MAG: type II toxin-antitoxin system HicA family toxin [Acidobacteria bacterium]|nr:type II toxin-antitoxin system HicA family toxin [Acidobacteriota bacterium]